MPIDLRSDFVSRPTEAMIEAMVAAAKERPGFGVRDDPMVSRLERLAAEILALARERGEPVLLATFAVHVPPGYSREAFDAGSLGYAKHGFPIEIWGRPENVVLAVQRHNR